MYVYKSVAKSWVTNAHHGSRSPAGLRRLGTATRISASLSRRLSAFFESTSRPRSQSGKVCRSDTRPGDVRERAARVEGNDSAPVRNAPCFAVCAVVCDPVSEGECVPAFDCESKRGPFVREVEKRDERWSEIEFEAAALTDFSLLLVLRVHSEPGNVCI